MELARQLELRGFSRPVAREALSRLEREGWLDDLSAAQSLVRARIGRYGRSRIERELAARGFSEKTIEKALSQADHGREEKALEQSFRRLWAAHAGVARLTRRRRVWNALLRRGFASESISDIMKGPDEPDPVDGGS